MKHTVLIVDDEKEIREAIALYLKNEGYMRFRQKMVWKHWNFLIKKKST